MTSSRGRGGRRKFKGWIPWIKPSFSAGLASGPVVYAQNFGMCVILISVVARVRPIDLFLSTIELEPWTGNGRKNPQKKAEVTQSLRNVQDFIRSLEEEPQFPGAVRLFHPETSACQWQTEFLAGTSSRQYRFVFFLFYFVDLFVFSTWTHRTHITKYTNSHPLRAYSLVKVDWPILCKSKFETLQNKNCLLKNKIDAHT